MLTKEQKIKITQNIYGYLAKLPVLLNGFEITDIRTPDEFDLTRDQNSAKLRAKKNNVEMASIKKAQKELLLQRERGMVYSGFSQKLVSLLENMLTVVRVEMTPCYGDYDVDGKTFCPQRQPLFAYVDKSLNVEIFHLPMLSAELNEIFMPDYSEELYGLALYLFIGLVPMGFIKNNVDKTL